VHRLVPSAVLHERPRRTQHLDPPRHVGAVIAQRQGQQSPGGQCPGEAVQSTGRRAQPFAEPRHPVSEREHAHIVVLGSHDQSLPAEQLSQRAPRYEAVVGDQQAPPAPTGQPGGERAGIRRGEYQRSPGGQQLGAAPERRHRIGEVLEHVGHHDRVEAPLLERDVLDAALDHRQRERIPRVAAALGGELHPADLVAAAAGLVQQQPVAGPDVEQPTRRYVGRH